MDEKAAAAAADDPNGLNDAVDEAVESRASNFALFRKSIKIRFLFFFKWYFHSIFILFYNSALVVSTSPEGKTSDAGRGASGKYQCFGG